LPGMAWKVGVIKTLALKETKKFLFQKGEIRGEKRTQQRAM